MLQPLKVRERSDLRKSTIWAADLDFILTSLRRSANPLRFYPLNFYARCGEVVHRAFTTSLVAALPRWERAGNNFPVLVVGTLRVPYTSYGTRSVPTPHELPLGASGIC